MSDPNKKLNSLILKLQKETGLKLTIASDKDPDQETLDKLEHLISQVKTTSSKSSVLSGYLNGVISESEARQLLIRKASDEKPAELFLLHFDNKLDEDSGVLSVLSELFDTSTTEILRMDDNEVLVLHFRHKEHDISELEETAGYLVDTMNTEALASVSVSYDSMALDFSELPLTYRHLKAAMKIGRTFRTSERIFGYHSLGLGKLISSISNESAREFLEEELPGIDFRQFDSETMNTIEVFFASGLNIAEAARALYLHRNTLVYRLDKFKKTTGCDLQNFDDAVKIRIDLIVRFPENLNLLILLLVVYNHDIVANTRIMGEAIKSLHSIANVLHNWLGVCRCHYYNILLVHRYQDFSLSTTLDAGNIDGSIGIIIVEFNSEILNLPPCEQCKEQGRNQKDPQCNNGEEDVQNRNSDRDISKNSCSLRLLPSYCLLDENILLIHMNTSLLLISEEIACFSSFLPYYCIALCITRKAPTEFCRRFLS